MGEIYDKWSVCDWKVRCWEQETTQVLPFGGEWMVESSCGVSFSGKTFSLQWRWWWQKRKNSQRRQWQWPQAEAKRSLRLRLRSQVQKMLQTRDQENCQHGGVTPQDERANVSNADHA